MPIATQTVHLTAPADPLLVTLKLLEGEIKELGEEPEIAYHLEVTVNRGGLDEGGLEVFSKQLDMSRQTYLRRDDAPGLTRAEWADVNKLILLTWDEWADEGVLPWCKEGP